MTHVSTIDLPCLYVSFVKQEYTHYYHLSLTMTEFGDVPASVLGMANVVNVFPATGDEVGVSAHMLNELLSAARSSNIHTKPPPAADKAKKKLLERLQLPVHPSHYNLFLALHLYPRAAKEVEEHILRSCLEYCANNDPEWVHSCQTGALKLLYQELDGAGLRTPKSDDPVLLAQVRSALSTPPPVGVVEHPRITHSSSHFRFVVDTTMEESKDRYFSSQIKFKNEGKMPASVQIARRLTLVDGMVQNDATDFQCILDKQAIKKGETSVLMLSLIAKPFAVFHTIQELLVVSFSDRLPIIASFVVVNPCTPAFGTGLPASIALSVQGSPIGPYHAPLTLQLLKHQFVRQQGFTSKEVAHVLCGPSHMYTAQNRDVMRQVDRILNNIDDSTDIGELLCAFNRAQPDMKSNSASSHLTLPPTLAQPPGYQPGAVVPSGSQASLTTFPNVQTAIPEPLVGAPPAVLFSLMLSWLSNLPNSVIDASILQCDPVTYLESLQPWQQGIIRWVLDLCCGLLVHKEDNDVGLRALALTFGWVLVAHEIHKQGHGDEFLDDAEGEGARLSQRDQEWRGTSNLRHYAVTAMVHWLTLYEGVYAKAAQK